MGKPQAPEAPDYAAAAREQGTANLEAATLTSKLSNPNIFSPYGTQTVEYFTGDRPYDTPVITQTLNPTAQSTLEQQQLAQLGLSQTANEQQQAVRQLLNTPFSFGGTPQMSVGADREAIYPVGREPTLEGGAGYGSIAGLDTSQVAQAPINAGTTAQQAIMQRLAPELARRRKSAENQLTQQGLVPGGEAYNNAITLLGQQENDALSQAALQGIGLDLAANQQGFGQAVTTQQALNAAQGQGFGQTQSQEAARNQAMQQNYQNQLAFQQAYNQAQQQGFGQNLQAGQFGNTALNQALAQALQLRDQPLNEIIGLMSGSQIQNPQFSPYQGSTVNAAPLFQATQQQGAWDQNIYNQQVAQRNALMGGLFSLGSAGLYGGLT